MHLKPFALVVVFAVIACLPARSQSVYNFDQGTVHFRSDAPLELIEATSKELKGLVNFAEGTFAFTVPVSTFEGFNSRLQREHFNENYMETEKYPRATFSGRLIESVDPTKDGDYTVRAKGKLNIHGVEQERIIKCMVAVRGGKVTVTSSFTVLLQEHNIAIPKVVQQKIAEEIYVDIKAAASPK